MEYMNSSPVMTMILQPEFSPSPPRPITYMISQPPPGPIKRFRTRDKAVNYPPQRSSSYSNTTSSHSPYVVSRRPHNQASQTPWNVYPDPEPAKRTPRIIRRPASSDSDARYSSSRRAPYAPRMMDTSRTSAMQPYPAAPNNPRIPEYDSIGDPYMMDFYAKKYGLRPQPPGRMERSWSAPGHGIRSSLPEGIKSYRFGSARARRSESYSSSRHRKRGIGQEIEYKITVKTGTKLNCGTDARVFIRMFGRRGKTQKMRLYKKSGQSNIKMFRYAKGSSHTFKIRAPDVGELKSIVIEHDGLEQRHSWFLEEVVITRRDRSYAFTCERWFSLFKGDCQLSRELNAVSGKQGRKIDYEITTVTGDKRGAGTDAHVFVTIHGSKGSTPRLQLRNDSHNTFERGKSDVFLLRTVNVGKIRKIRIEIDNQGFAPAWYLERVVILTPTQRMHFPCGEWLGDDDQLYRDLVGSEDPSGVGKSNIYTITVFTGDVRGAGTDSNVFLTIFGDLGDSGQKILDDNRNNFERGKKDVFKVKCPNVGKLKKIRIGHDNSGASSGWFLEKIAIDDSSTGRVYTFPCGRWFAKDEDDGRITRELIAGKGDAGIPYTIKIFTGDVRGAGTSANVYIILYGGKRGEQNTGKIQLQGKFERNRQDICHVESASMLSPLDKIEIGHDNSGAGAGWFVDKVIIVCNSTGCEQVFSCSKWFATDEGDGLISRELYESKSLRKQVVQKTAWNCTIWTTDVRNAGTDAKVFLQIYGDKGKSDEIPIKNESDNFEAGQKDTFKIDFVNVGTVYKLRVWHDNSRSFAGWHLDKIVFEPVGGKKKENYTFNCGKWLDESEGDCEIIRELPASGPLVRKPQPLVRYIVSVTTGDKRNAGTDANVFLCLFGAQGDTGNRPLQRSKSNKNKFEKKNVDEFVIEAVTLKELTKVRIGHDDSGPGSGWFLEKVEAWEEGKGIKTVFPCGRWLATDEDDGLIIRELTPEGTPQLLNTTTYHVSVKTGDVSGAGTDADVFIKIFGSDGDTGRLKLHQGENIRNKFERGRTDMFKLEATDIGKLERIILGHDDSGIGAGWFLDGVEIDVPSSGMHYTFNCHRWLATDEEDGKTTVELYPTQTRQQDKLLPYEITVKTGDKLNSGTNANVTLQIYGEDGKSEVLQLRNRTDNFERDATDKFKVEAQDVGPITKIRLGHDGKGAGPGWFVDQVTIQRFVKRTSKRKKKRRESLSPDRGDVETYWFVCRRWFDKDEDDGQIIRELVPTDESGKPIDEALQEKEYSVHVFTGDKLGAGTDADVFMTLYGDTGDSGERKLAKSETNINKFERNQEDIFKIRAADLGDLKKMKIRRDNAVVGAAWYLDRVEVRSAESHLIFPCQRWLSTKEDDGQIERMLVPVSQEIYQRLQSQDKKKSKVRDAIALETKAQLTTYEVTVKTGDMRSGGTDANVYMIMYGENDDSGKINLKSSKTYRDKFERDHADVFTVESADLGNLKKIKIGHDNSGIGAGWYLEYVDIDAPSMGLKWHFPCGRWVDKDRDDGLLERDLYPSDHGTMEYMAKVPYEISVTTSDISGSGSDADVYIVLYGRDGVATEQASLCPNKDDRKSKYFKRKATDTFVLELDDIGETIEKIRIGHNGKGFGAGWHLDKVQIRRLLDGAKGSETYFFNCGRWLARDEDDGQIVRELVPVKKFEDKISRSGKLKRMESTLSDTLKNQQYRIHVFTGDVFNAGTDANVYITMAGENGDSGERKLLKSETYKDKFERGHEDIFTVEAVDLGKLYKLHIRHDNSLLNPAWYLDRVEIEDCETTSDRFVFHCERWLAKGKEDGKIARSLYVVGYDGETSTKRSAMTGKSFGSVASKKLIYDAIPEGPTIPYTIKVHTGSVGEASCSAEGFLRVFGPKSKGGQKVTHKIPLVPENGKFKKGTVETFNVEALDVGEIKAIEVGHVGVDDRWYIEEVVIDQPTIGKNLVFQCMKWFARDREEGLTSRTLFVADASSSIYKAKIPYEITVYTGNESGAGTDGRIVMSVYGSKGNTPDIPIMKSEEEGILLERGSIDVIRTEMDDIAPLKMVKLTHNGKGQRPDWFCEKVQLRNLKSGKVTVFPCEAWLSKNKGDKKLTREISASIGGRSVLKQTTHQITVKTSDMTGSGTNANVSMELFGDHGESGELRLEKSETHQNKFESGNEDTFVFRDKLSIGEIRKCRVWHDSKGFRPGWHLDWVEVRDEETAKTARFNCGRWLSKDEDDGQTMRELQALGGSRPTSGSSSRRARTPSIAVDAKPTKYEITVVTSEEKGSGTDANVSVTLYGENANSGQRPLKQRFRDLFERGQTDKFTFELLNLGELTKLRLEHDDSGFNSDWLCDHIIVRDTSNGRSWKFPCREWIGGKKGKDQLYRDLQARSM